MFFLITFEQEVWMPHKRRLTLKKFQTNMFKYIRFSPDFSSSIFYIQRPRLWLIRRWLTRTVRYLMIRQMWNSRRGRSWQCQRPFVSMICIAQNIELQYPGQVINLIFAQFTADRSPTQGAVEHDCADKLKTKSIINTLCTWYEWGAACLQTQLSGAAIWLSLWPY